MSLLLESRGKVGRFVYTSDNLRVLKLAFGAIQRSIFSITCRIVSVNFGWLPAGIATISCSHPL